MTDDLIIIGGSFAGLSAALQLARTGRTVRIIDAGKPFARADRPGSRGAIRDPAAGSFPDTRDASRMRPAPAICLHGKQPAKQFLRQ
jgi:2-polyprenyl-6-methoxyphenol hydroxylase-like FAD-dependent oxidoreductase